TSNTARISPNTGRKSTVAAHETTRCIQPTRDSTALTFRHVCRAGFAGRGTPLALSIRAPHSPSVTDPRRGLGSPEFVAQASQPGKTDAFQRGLRARYRA